MARVTTMRRRRAAAMKPTQGHSLLFKLTAMSSFAKTAFGRTVGASYDTVTKQVVQQCNGSNPITFTGGHCPNFINCMLTNLPPATTAGFQSGGNIAALVPTILALIGSPPLELVQLAFISPHRAIATCLFSIGLPSTLFRQLRPKLPELADRDGNEDIRRREWVIPLSTFDENSSLKRFIGRLIADFVVVGLGALMLWRNWVVGSETMVTWRCEYSWLLFFWPFACVIWLLIAMVLLYFLSKEISITYHDGIAGSTPKQLNVFDLLALPYFKPKHATRTKFVYAEKDQEAEIEAVKLEVDNSRNDYSSPITQDEDMIQQIESKRQPKAQSHGRNKSLPLVTSISPVRKRSMNKTVLSPQAQQIRPLISKYNNDVDLRYRTSSAPMSAQQLSMQEYEEDDEEEEQQPVSPIQRTNSQLSPQLQKQKSPQSEQHASSSYNRPRQQPQSQPQSQLQSPQKILTSNPTSPSSIPIAIDSDLSTKIQAKRLSIRRRRKAALAAEQRHQQRKEDRASKRASEQAQLQAELLASERRKWEEEHRKPLPRTPPESLDPSYRVTIMMRSPSPLPLPVPVVPIKPVSVNTAAMASAPSPTVHTAPPGTPLPLVMPADLSYEKDGFFRSISSWQWYEAIIETLAVGIYLYATFVLTSVLFLSGEEGIDYAVVMVLSLSAARVVEAIF